MKKISLLFAGLLAFTACQSSDSGETSSEEASQESSADQKSSQSEPGLEQVWETDTILPVNESVLPYQGLLYVSNIAGKPTDQNGTGFIARLNPDGSIAERQWATGLDAPKGMGVYQNKLYVTDVDELVQIDLEDPSQQQRFPVEGAVFLNDVTVGREGLYFSDMKTGKLHHFAQGEVSTVDEGLKGINGLAYSQEEGLLYLLTAEGLLRRLDDGSYETVNAQVTNGDGLVLLGDGAFIASRWQGEIWYLDEERATKMLDSKDQEIQTADLGYDPQRNMLYVPRFFAQKVTAFQFSP